MPGEITQESPGTPVDAGAPAPVDQSTNSSGATGGLADAAPGDKSFALSDAVMFSSDLDEITLPQEPDLATPPSPVQPSEVAAPAPQATPPAQPQTPQAQTAPQGQPSAQPAPQAPSATQPQAQQPGPPQGAAPPADLMTELARYKNDIIGDLAAKRFALTPEDISALETDAVGTIPKLLARTYYEAATTTLNQINNMVPRLIEHVVNESRATNAAEDSFYREWPSIDRVAHASQVQLAANLYRQANPPPRDPSQGAAWQAGAIRAVGSMVSTMLGLPVVQRAPANGGNGGARPPSARPFSPASGGGRVASTNVIPNPGDAFAGMGMNFDE